MICYEKQAAEKSVMKEIPPWIWVTVVFTGVGIILAIGKWIGNVNTDRKSFKEFMKGVEKKIEKINDKFDDKFEKINDKFDDKFEKINDKLEKIFHLLHNEPIEKRTSPISLTDYGQKLSQEISASEISDMELTNATEQVKDCNAYQIQEYCFEFAKNALLKKLNEKHRDFYDKIHEVAFNEGIEVEKLTRVIALELRDKILSSQSRLHSEINQHEPGS